jgi:glucokinase
LQVAINRSPVYYEIMKKKHAQMDESYVLAGDIGGTNTGLAIVQRDSRGVYKILAREAYSTQKLKGLEEAIDDALVKFKDIVPQEQLDGICISVAGPVEANYCKTTNIDWDVDGNAIADHTGIQTLLINDFSAVCYGIPLLDPENPEELTKLYHPDGSFPSPKDFLVDLRVQAVIGAGTGLGCGYLIREQGRYIAFPTERGHADFGGYDDISREIQKYHHEKIGKNPGAEQFVSGRGIANIFEYLAKEKEKSDLPLHKEILGLSTYDQAPAISKNVDNDELCKRTMEIFVEMFARVAMSTAVSYIPKGGLFLAGGIAAKNKKFFIEGDRFMKYFLNNYMHSIAPLLKEIPVYIVEDYKISLFGAAYGFHSLQARSISRKR